MKNLIPIFIPVIMAILASLGWWLDRIDNRIYQFQTNYVTHAQLEKTVRSLENTIKNSLDTNTAAREVDRAMMTQWMTRVETNQQILNDDIKKLLKEVR